MAVAGVDGDDGSEGGSSFPGWFYSCVCSFACLVVFTWEKTTTVNV